MFSLLKLMFNLTALLAIAVLSALYLFDQKPTEALDTVKAIAQKTGIKEQVVNTTSRLVDSIQIGPEPKPAKVDPPAKEVDPGEWQEIEKKNMALSEEEMIELTFNPPDLEPGPETEEDPAIEAGPTDTEFTPTQALRILQALKDDSGGRKP